VDKQQRQLASTHPTARLACYFSHVTGGFYNCLGGVTRNPLLKLRAKRLSFTFCHLFVSVDVYACRLFEAELQKQQEELRAKRMSQVGTGDRSEKIKTYNYKDSRCSDHRLKMNYDLNKQLDGEIEDNIQVCWVLA
jgi:hypothetical protein